MFELINDLDAEQRKKLVGLANEGRREIRLARDHFKLEVKSEYVHRVMAGHLSILWAILEDSRAKKLEGFGGVSTGLAADLDPRIENLVRVVNSMKSWVTAENPK